MVKKYSLSSLFLLIISFGLIIASVWAASVWAEEMKNPEANDNIKYNVVVEGARAWFGGERVSTGSGVLVSEDGLVLTARHVVKLAKTVRVTLPDGRVFDVNEWYVDPNNDVAVIDLPIEVNEYATFADTNSVEPGDKIHAVGNAYGIWDDTVTFGEIHKIKFKRIMLGRDCEVVFAKLKIVPGNSGGGVYEGDGLIGIAIMLGPRDAAFIVPSYICEKAIEDYRCQDEQLQKLSSDLCKGWLQEIFSFLE